MVGGRRKRGVREGPLTPAPARPTRRYIFFFQAPFLPELVISYGNYQMLHGIFRGRRMGLRNRFRITDEDMAAFRYAMSRPGAATAMVNYYRNLLTASSQRVQGVLEVPTLLLWVRGAGGQREPRSMTAPTPAPHSRLRRASATVLSAKS